MSSFVGQMMGRYHIVEQLGEGGMAIVYKGYDTTLQRNVAIKVIKSDRTEDTSFRKRFEREARALAQLSHPHIVHINDFGEQSGLAYLVMDYISGGTLKTRMGRPMPYQEAARMLAPMAQALGFAHQHKIVHRDVKPANILLTETGIPMLSDFGIAKMLEAPVETLDLTSSGMGVGTPAYMAPEQAGGHFDHRADIYSLGVVFYELVTGRRPYDADTPLATLMKHATDPLPPPRNFVPSLPEAVEQVIYKALAKNPNDRFQSMEEYAHQLEQLQFGNLQPTFTRVAQPEGQTLLAPRTPPGGATMLAPTGYPPAYTPPQGSPTPPPILKTSQESGYAPYPQSPYQQPYQQPYTQAPMQAPVYAQPQKQSSRGKWIAAALAVVALSAILVVVAAGGLYYFWPALVETSAPQPVSGTGAALNQTMMVMTGEWGTVTARAKGTTFVSGETTRQVGNQAAAATQAAVSSTQAVGGSTQQSGGVTKTNAAQQTAAAQDAAAMLLLPRVAFFDNANIWSVGLDGKNLVQMTTNGGDKRALRWMPDGKSLYYISGNCVQAIDFVSKVESKLVCFNFGQAVTGFEISPDGKAFGVLINNNLYLGRYDLAAIKKLTVKAALADYANSTCGYLSGVRFFHILGGSSQVAVTALAPGEDVVRINSLNCTTQKIYKQDEFPAERFRPFKFVDNPVIYDFGWNGLRQYSLTTNLKGKSLGYFYLYNNENKTGAQSKPLDSDCCYSSPAFSYDGSYLAFGFIELSNITTDNMHLYAVPFSDLGTGKKFNPIPLPQGMLKGAGAAPQPAIYIPQPQ